MEKERYCHKVTPPSLDYLSAVRVYMPWSLNDVVLCDVVLEDSPSKHKTKKIQLKKTDSADYSER